MAGLKNIFWESDEHHYRAEYPGVLIHKHYNYDDKAEVCVRFGPHTTVQQIEHAVQSETERIRAHGEINWGFSLLIACNHGDLDQVEFCLSKGADPAWENGELAGFPATTPMAIACVRSDLRLLDRLLAAGGTPGITEMFSAIERAEESPAGQTLSVLDRVLSLIPPESYSGWDFTPVEYCDEWGFDATKGLLLERGYA